MIGIVIGFVLFVSLICLQFNIVFAAPLASAIISWLNGFDVYQTLTSSYLVALSSFIQKYAFVFLLSSLLGKLMEASGDGKLIGVFVTKVFGIKRAALGIFVTSGLMTYSGIDGFVIIYTVYVIACAAFNRAGLPRSFIIACIAGGNLVMGLNIPGTALVHNLILMEHFKTSATAGLSIGLAAAISGFLFAVYYLEKRTKKYHAEAESTTEFKPLSTCDEELEKELYTRNKWALCKAFAPFMCVIITLSFLKLPPVLSIGSGVALSLILNMRKIQFRKVLNESIGNALLPMFYAASIMGFSQVLSQMPVFSALMDNLLALPYSPYILVSIITNIAAGLTGSASGGLLLVLGTVGDKLLLLGDPQLMHRIMLQSSTVLDSLPHCGAYLTMLAYTGLKFKDTYYDYFMTTVIAPLIGLIMANILILVFY